MKLLLALFLLTGIYACEGDVKEAGPVSTVDSTLIDAPADTVSPLMYLDSQSSNVALDSAGPMVTAQDTTGLKQ